MNLETSRREVPGIQGLFISTCLVFKRGLGMENTWYAGMGGCCTWTPINISFPIHFVWVLLVLSVTSNTILQRSSTNPKKVSSSQEHCGSKHEKPARAVAMLWYLGDGHYAQRDFKPCLWPDVRARHQSRFIFSSWEGSADKHGASNKGAMNVFWSRQFTCSQSAREDPNT